VVAIVLRSDDPEDLTLREARLLGIADTLLVADNVPPAILARARADARRLPLARAAEASGMTLAILREGAETVPD
jgi:uroporphyrin-III C-methyltransferase/precorrin-2 dehydrogenase/sirohydrochlorin ferrochelatase